MPRETETFWSIHRFSGGVCLEYSNWSNRNAWSVDTCEQFLKLARKEVTDGARVVALLMGRPHALPFCSGGDLKTYKNLRRPAALETHKKIARLLDQFSALPALTLAFVGGNVWGGGWEILTAFDSFWTHPQTSFRFQQARLGLGPGWGGGARLARREMKAVVTPWILGGLTLTSREIQSSGWGAGLLPAGVFSDAVFLKAWLANHFQHTQNFEKSAWKKLVTALRSGRDTSERTAFNSLWGTGYHQGFLNEFWSTPKSQSQKKSTIELTSAKQ